MTLCEDSSENIVPNWYYEKAQLSEITKTIAQAPKSSVGTNIF